MAEEQPFARTPGIMAAPAGAARLSRALACPLCGGAILLVSDVRCAACGRVFPQDDARVLDLWARDQWDSRTTRWAERQAAMTAYYRDLAADPARTRTAYLDDLGPFRPLFADMRGPVLDLGGGNGLIRDFLPAGIDYVSLDPSVDWFDVAWQASADTFPSLAHPPFFVRGVGERIPFRTGTFATVLSIWSLNHTVNPAQVISEAARVLAPNGRFALCLEDIPPRWSDAWTGAYRDHRFPSRTARVVAKVKSLVAGWPLQPDHLRLSERQVMAWATVQFTLAHRTWLGSYLLLDFRARG